MKVIYKYRLGKDVQFGEASCIDVPGYVRVVHFDRDGLGYISVWAEVDSNPRYAYKVPVFVVPTGYQFDAAKNKASYHSTMNDDGFFWHLYVGAPASIKVVSMTGLDQ